MCLEFMAETYTMYYSDGVCLILWVYEELLSLVYVLQIQMKENSVPYFHKKHYTVHYGEVGF